MCPECNFVRIPNHPNGPLVTSHASTCSLGKQWDAVQAADADRTEEYRKVTRTPRQVEVDLAVALGLGTPSSVVVERLTDSAAIIKRTYTLEA